MPRTKKKPAGKPKPKVLSVQMSTQFKTFLAGASSDEYKSILDVVDKIARGEIKGKKVDWSALSDEAKESIRIAQRELVGKKPIVA